MMNLLRSFLMPITILAMLVSLLILGWWSLAKYRHQSTVNWQEIDKEDYVDAKKIKNFIGE